MWLQHGSDEQCGIMVWLNTWLIHVLGMLAVVNEQRTLEIPTIQAWCIITLPYNLLVTVAALAGTGSSLCFQIRRVKRKCAIMTHVCARSVLKHPQMQWQSPDFSGGRLWGHVLFWTHCTEETKKNVFTSSWTQRLHSGADTMIFNEQFNNCATDEKKRSNKGLDT